MPPPCILRNMFTISVCWTWLGYWGHDSYWRGYSRRRQRQWLWWWRVTGFRRIGIDGDRCFVLVRNWYSFWLHQLMCVWEWRKRVGRVGKWISCMTVLGIRSACRGSWASVNVSQWKNVNIVSWLKCSVSTQSAYRWNFRLFALPKQSGTARDTTDGRRLSSCFPSLTFGNLPSPQVLEVI